MPDIGAMLEAHLGPIARSLDSLPAQLADRDDAFLRELTRGVKYIRQPVSLTPAATSYTFTGPEQGFAWDVKLITGTLSVNDSVAAYVGDQANNRLIGYAAAPGAAPAQLKFIIPIASHSAVVNPGEPVFIQTSGAGNLVMVMLAALEAPAEMISKILI